ncbi:MAG: hypothetical protein K2Q26_05165 [Bdellovibrionales bacterium]|nr:hypothetical protein [Bdellovibrionales bacterium]
MMKIFPFKRIFFLCTMISISGCTQAVNDWVNGGGGTTGHAGIVVTVVSKSTAIADGFSELMLTLNVQDRLGNPQQNISVLFDRDVFSGINSLNCTDSDQNGITICRIRAHRDGVKDLKITGKEQVVQVEFFRQFDKQAQLFDALGASHSTMMAGPDLIKGSAGKRIDKPLIEETNLTLRSDASITH